MLGTQISVLIALLSVLALLYVHRKNARRSAASKFRAALYSAFSGLYPIPSNWPRAPNEIDKHLRRIFPDVQAAVAEYRHYVPWYKRKSFDEAWRLYRLDKDGREIDRQLYFHYMGFQDPGKSHLDPKATFHNNVDRLISFASDV